MLRKLTFLFIFLMMLAPRSMKAFSSGNVSYEVISEADATCRVVGLSTHMPVLSLTIPETVMQGKMPNITLYKVVEIANSAFRDAQVVSVVYPWTLETVGDYAFANSTLLEFVPAASSRMGLSEPQLKSISFSAFESTNLNKLYIPQNVMQYAVTATSFCSNLTEYEVHPANAYFESDYQGVLYTKGRQILVSAPAKLQYVHVSEDTWRIESCAFLGSKLSDISFPPHLQSIGASAFSQTPNLGDIRLPEDVTDLESSTFEGSGLHSIVLGSKITSINSQVFQNCTNLRRVVMQGDVNQIAKRSFYNCSNLETIQMPNVTECFESNSAWINTDHNPYLYVPERLLDSFSANYCWYHWTQIVPSLERTTLYSSDNVPFVVESDFPREALLGELTAEQIAEHGFDYNPLPTSVFPQNTWRFYTIMGLTENALHNATSSFTLSLPEGYRYIFGSPFDGCSVMFLTFPSTIDYVDEGFLRGANRLSQVYVDTENPRYYNPLASDGHKLSCMVVDRKRKMLVSTCPQSTFDLVIDVPEGIQLIGRHAFDGVAQETITLPSTVREMGSDCFVSSLTTSIVCRATEPPYAPFPMIESERLDKVTLYVPSESIDLYRMAPNWRGFAHIEPIAEEYYTLNGITYRLNLKENTCSVVKGDLQVLQNTVEIPQTVNYNQTPFLVNAIEEFAFQDCAGISKLILPATVHNIGQGFVLGCTGLLSFDCGSNPYYHVNKYGGLVSNYDDRVMAMPAGKEIEYYIPESDELNFMPYSMAYCKVTDVYFYDYGKTYTIGDYTFYGCETLHEVKILDRSQCVQNLGIGTFIGCSNLERIDLPYNITILPTDVFRNCTNLKYVHLYGNIKSIGDNAFDGCPNLLALEMPNVENVVLANSSIFDEKLAVAKVSLYVSELQFSLYRSDALWGKMNVMPHTHTFSDGVNGYTIMSMSLSEAQLAFAGHADEYGIFLINNTTTSVNETVAREYTITSIGQYAFSHRPDIKILSLSSSVRDINNHAFSSDYIESLSFSSGTRYIDNMAMSEMPMLQDVIMNSNPYFTNPVGPLYDYTDYSCLIDVNRQALVRQAPRRWRAWNWEEADNELYEVPQGIRRIDDYALQNCKFQQINFNTEVEEIGEYVFDDMTELRLIYFPTHDQKMPKIDLTSFGTLNPSDKTLAIRSEEAMQSYNNLMWSTCKTLLVKNVDGMNFMLHEPTDEQPQRTATMLRCDLNRAGDYVTPEYVSHNGKDYLVNAARPAVFRGCKELHTVDFNSHISDVTSFMFDNTKLSRIIFRNCDQINLHHFSFRQNWMPLDIYLPALHFTGTDCSDALGFSDNHSATLHVQPLMHEMMANTDAFNITDGNFLNNPSLVAGVEDLFDERLTIDPRPMYEDNGSVKSLNEVTVRVNSAEPIKRITFYVQTSTDLTTDTETRTIFSDWREQSDAGYNCATPLFAFNPELEALGYKTDVLRNEENGVVNYGFVIEQKDHLALNLDGMKLCDICIGIDRDEFEALTNNTHNYLNLCGTRIGTADKTVEISNLVTPLNYLMPQINANMTTANAVLKMDVNTDGEINVADIISIQGRIKGKKTHFNPALAPNFTNEKLQECILFMREAILVKE